MDPYAVLGVSAAAGQDEIRRAWRRRARQTHPDLGGDRTSFERAQAAFALLADPARLGTSAAPELVVRLGPPEHVRRWYRRRRDRVLRPRVV